MRVKKSVRIQRSEHRERLEQAMARLESGAQTYADVLTILGIIENTLSGFDSRILLGIKRKRGARPRTQFNHLMMAFDYWMGRQTEPKEEVVARAVALDWNRHVSRVRKIAGEHHHEFEMLADEKGLDYISGYLSHYAMRGGKLPK